MSKPKIAILGAGPTGLEAALAAAEHGFPFTLYEAGSEVAGHVRAWGHVRLFTPWSMNVSERARRALEAAGRDVPASEECPTGAELIKHVLWPVAALPRVAENVRLGTRVARLGRRGLLKHDEIGTGRRGGHPFRLLLEDRDGRQWTEDADIVFDCTGASEPNPLGDGGIPAPGEERADGTIHHDIPDFARETEPWVGKRTLVVGAGHSAQTALVALAELAEKHPGTKIVWALRGASPKPVDDDPLPGRSRLTGRVAELAAGPPEGLEVHRGVVVEALEEHSDDDGDDDGGVTVTLRRDDGTTETVDVDGILALTGKVGDHLLYRQLQVHECYATSGPMKLAAALLGEDGAASGGAAGGDCLDQSSLGAETLRNPEPGFFILGLKSYGRRNDFLMRVGWQQVDEVFELLDD